MHFFPVSIPRMTYLVLHSGLWLSGFSGEQFICQSTPDRKERIPAGRKNTQLHRKRTLKHKQQNPKPMCVYINVLLYQKTSRITISFRIYCHLFLKITL